MGVDHRESVCAAYTLLHRKLGEPCGEVDGGEDPPRGVAAGRLGEAEAERRLVLVRAALLVVGVEVAEAQQLNMALHEVARVERVALPLVAIAGYVVPARARRSQAAGVNQDRIVEQLAALGVALVHRPGLRDGVLEPVFTDILGQVAGDGVEDAAADLVLEGAAQISRDVYRHGGPPVQRAHEGPWPT